MSDDILNPALRDAMVSHVTGFTVVSDLREVRTARLLRSATYPPLPPDLYGIVPLDVEAAEIDAETGEVVYEYSTVVSNRLTVDTHGDAAIPNLLQVDVVQLRDIELSLFSGYCLAFREYLEGCLGDVEDAVSTMEQQHKELVGSLPSCAWDGVSFAKADRAAKNDPFVRELERSIRSSKQLVTSIKRRIGSITDRIKLNSREQTRRGDAMRVLGNTRGTAEPGMGSPPGRSYSASRQMAQARGK